MIIENKNKFIKRLFIYKHLKFVKFETNIKDRELEIIINTLNIKSNSKRYKYLIESTCNYIDNYYKNCNACQFKNNKCICHRLLNKEYTNGCCRKCKHQSAEGCTTKNIACKLFYCSKADLKNKKKLSSKDLKMLKILNPMERYIITNDYFRTIKQVVHDIYLWQTLFILLIIIQVVLVVIR